MLKLNPILSEKIWGYEQWIASTHPDGRQKDFFEALGKEYPLLVKVIQANDTLSVQVHPDDEQARLLENDPRGKTECWYVLHAEPGAKLVFGLNREYSTSELKKAIDEKALESCLNSVEVHAGDFIFIPSGTVHAIGGGLRLLEVQQSSNITYRLYDWGRPRELHVEKGLKVIKNRGLQNPVKFSGNFDCEYFTLEEVSVNGNYEYSVSQSKDKEPYNWQLFFILEGSGKAESASSSESENEAGTTSVSYNFAKEDIFAVAPGEKVKISGNCRIMKIICKKQA